MSDTKAYTIATTKDGSHTVLNHALNQTYHSRHGAVQESMHVFIKHGLMPKLQQLDKVHVFEMGFGTALNAWLTAIQAMQKNVPVYYESIEAFPLQEDIWQQLNYASSYHEENALLFHDLHKAPWDNIVQIDEFFTIKKIPTILSQYAAASFFDIIYYDAFSPNAQPELWTTEVFSKLSGMMKSGAILTTYCSKSDVRRNMQAAGFVVEKLQGPPGKREILRATKP